MVAFNISSSDIVKDLDKYVDDNNINGDEDGDDVYNDDAYNLYGEEGWIDI